MKSLVIFYVLLFSSLVIAGVFSSQDLHQLVNLLNENGARARYYPATEDYRERVEVTHINSCHLKKMYLDNNFGFLLLVEPEGG